MTKAKLWCQESFGRSIKILEIRNIGDGDAYNIRLSIPDNVIIIKNENIFPFPKLEAKRKIEVSYIIITPTKETPAYTPLEFLYNDDEGEKSFTFYMVTAQ